MDLARDTLGTDRLLHLVPQCGEINKRNYRKREAVGNVYLCSGKAGFELYTCALY